MNEVQSNKHAWSQVSEDHYHAFKERYAQDAHHLSSVIVNELGDLSGKRILHLQCNTGADTIALAKRGAAHVVGVDLVPQNVLFAQRLADDLGVKNVSFIESDIMTLMNIHHDTYDLVFTSEGAIGWLPDLDVWAKTIRHCLKPTGHFYAFDSHPVLLMFDETKLKDDITEVKYPYFGKVPECSDSIGGYASPEKHGVEAYFWNYTVGDLINKLTDVGLHIEFFHEFPELFYDLGGMVESPINGLMTYPHNPNRYPLSFSLLASVYPGR